MLSHNHQTQRHTPDYYTQLVKRLDPKSSQQFQSHQNQQKSPPTILRVVEVGVRIICLRLLVLVPRILRPGPWHQQHQHHPSPHGEKGAHSLIYNIIAYISLNNFEVTREGC